MQLKYSESSNFESVTLCKSSSAPIDLLLKICSNRLLHYYMGQKDFTVEAMCTFGSGAGPIAISS